MVTDDLTNLLSRVQFMRVISRQTALSFKGQAIDVAAVGADLHVRYVLDGSLRMQGDKLRVNIELIDPKTRLPVWSTRIERDGADRLGVLDELVGRLARELQFEILPIESARRANDHDTDALIYRGWAALYDISKAGYKRAESYFTQAVERDPDNLAARIGLGAYHARIGALALDADSDAHRAKALELLRDALQRDPQSSTANFYIGLALNKDARTLPQSIQYMQRAIALNPSFPAAYAHIGHGLSRMGKPDEGIGYIRYAMRLSPRDPTTGVFLEMAGNAELELGHSAEAVESFSRASMLMPGYPRIWAGLAATHALAGRIAEARDCVRKLKALAPTLTPPALLEQYGRRQASQLHRGLEIAIAADSDGDAQLSASGPKPSRTQ
jgi:tetratricopeptide (TPR) repeat protein